MATVRETTRSIATNKVLDLALSLLDERQQLLELLCSRAAQQLVHHHLGGGDDRAGITHALEADLPIPLRARADGIGGDVDSVSIVERAQRSLRHADV